MSKILYFFIFFPFLRIGGSWSDFSSPDLQPFSLMASMIMILYICAFNGTFRLKKYQLRFYFVIIFGFFVAFVITLLKGISYSLAIRNIATTASLVCISYTSYFLCNKYGGYDEKFIKLSINSYLLVGLIQKFIDRDFLYEFVSNARTSAGRGVVSLASEPSFYGYLCIFFIILAFDFKKGRRLYIMNLLFQIIFLAKSSVTILYLAVFLGVYLLYFISKQDMKNMIKIVFGGGIVFGCFMIYLRYNSDQRVAFIANLILSGWKQGGLEELLRNLMSDASISSRFLSIVGCFRDFISQLGIPYGYVSKNFQSGYGNLMYVMGWFGVAIIVCIFFIIKRAYSDYRKTVLPIFLTIIMFSAIQVALPVFLFCIGYFMYLGDKRELFEKT